MSSEPVRRRVIVACYGGFGRELAGWLRVAVGATAAPVEDGGVGDAQGDELLVEPSGAVVPLPVVGIAREPLVAGPVERMDMEDRGVVVHALDLVAHARAGREVAPRLGVLDRVAGMDERRGVGTEEREELIVPFAAGLLIFTASIFAGMTRHSFFGSSVGGATGVAGAVLTTGSAVAAVVAAGAVVALGVLLPLQPATIAPSTRAAPRVVMRVRAEIDIQLLLGSTRAATHPRWSGAVA